MKQFCISILTVCAFSLTACAGTNYGIASHSQLKDTPDIACIDHVLRSNADIQIIDFRQEQSTPGRSMTSWMYKIQGFEEVGYLTVYYDAETGRPHYKNAYSSIARKIPTAEMDAVSPIISRIDISLFTTCHLQSSTSLKISRGKVNLDQ